MGTNTLVDPSAGIIDDDDMNQIITALQEDFVPRNASNVPADIAGGLGDSSATWNRAFLKSITLGAVSSGLKIKNVSDDIVFDVGGSEMARIGRERKVITIDGTDPGMGGVSIARMSPETYSATTASYTDIPGLSLSLTTSGRPVFLGLMGDENWDTNGSYFKTQNLAHSWVGFYDSDAAALVYAQRVYLNLDTSNVPKLVMPTSMFHTIIVPSAGTQNIKVQMKSETTGSTTILQYASFVAFELAGF